MRYSIDACKEGCRSGVTQERRYAGKEGDRKGKTQETRDSEQE